MGASQLLDAWEAGWDRTPVEQGLAMLAVAGELSAGDCAALTLGQRDRALFGLRAVLFGSIVDAVSRCPDCATEVEVTFDQDEVLDRGVDGPTSVDVGGRGYRLPTTADVAALLHEQDPHLATTALLRRCAVDTDPVVSDGEAAEILAAWSAADPLLDLELGLTCPGCGAAWSDSFDIVSYLWSELDRWCRRTLLEVHDLACAYGWTERETLALSAWRRQCYLGLVDS